MWEFYLAGFEAAFRYDDLVVFQFHLAKNLDAVPRTRGYLYRQECRPEGSSSATDVRRVRDLTNVGAGDVLGHAGGTG